MWAGVAASAAAETVVIANAAASATQAAKNASRRAEPLWRAVIEARWLVVVMVESLFTEDARLLLCGFKWLRVRSSGLRCRMGCRRDSRPVGVNGARRG